jgi:hypothetical protein
VRTEENKVTNENYSRLCQSEWVLAIGAYRIGLNDCCRNERLSLRDYESVGVSLLGAVIGRTLTFRRKKCIACSGLFVCKLTPTGI